MKIFAPSITARPSFRSGQAYQRSGEKSTITAKAEYGKALSVAKGLE